MRTQGRSKGVGLVAIAAAALLAAAAVSGLAAPRRKQAGPLGVDLSDEEFRKLDTFEAHAMARADKVFGQGDYKRAASEYDSFILEFPKSKAIPYALLRKAQCLQQLKKRHKAIEEYTEVLDYFPNAVKYASAALYYTGLCHWENGDEQKAMRAWARLAQDKDYNTQPLAADALNQLADYLVRQKKPAEAIVYSEKVAIEFRRRRPQAAKEARARVIHYYVKSAPNEPKLRELYKNLYGFDDRPRRLRGEVAQDRRYWEHLRHYVRRFAGEFRDLEKDLKAQYFQYWADRMAGAGAKKFGDWDDYQIDLAWFRLQHERDGNRWIERLDQQFERYQKPGDWSRIIRWIRIFGRKMGKVRQYYEKLDFAKMKPAQVRSLLEAAFVDVGDRTFARSVFDRLPLGKMSDDEKAHLAGWLWRHDADMVKTLCAAIEDADRGRYELLRYYHFKRDHKNGVPLADQVVGVPRYASDANWKKGELLMWAGKYKEAIAAFQAADNPPDNAWKIAECYDRMGQLKQAVLQLKEIENFFKDHAPRAAMKIADLYRKAKLSKTYHSPQSREAHHRLERMGVRIGGGVEADP